MIGFIVRRLASAVVIVLMVSIIVFVLIRLVPGDPLSARINLELEAAMGGGVAIDPVAQQMIIDRVRDEFGMNYSWPVQYFNWLRDMATGNFGTSMVQGYDIATEILHRMPITIYLGILSMIVSLILGILFGTIAAVRNGSWIDNLITSISNIGMTIPAFLVAILGIWLFGFTLGLLPMWGFETPWGDAGIAVSVRHTILPVFAMSVGGIAGLARMTRSAMLDVLNADHVRTAWAKGMRERVVIFKHVLKNGMMPIVSGFGGMIRGIFGGSVIIETLFLIPGVGNLIVTGTQQLDYTVIQATTVMFTLITVVSNLVVDLMYGWVDPRISIS